MVSALRLGPLSQLEKGRARALASSSTVSIPGGIVHGIIFGSFLSDC